MIKEGWATVTLGDIAENISVRVDDPSKSGLDRFVGLVHLDSGSVTVSRWDSTESVTSSMKQFQAGDVLLARRNAHLRRASAVDFEGVCSGDAYVLREKPDAIVPGLLKYILNTNRFWEYAIANADGSMSTRVKWKNIEAFRLKIPIENSALKILKKLDCFEELAVSLFDLEQKYIVAKKKFASNSFRVSQEHTTCLGDIADIKRGKSPRPINDPKYWSSDGPGWVRIGDVTSSKRLLTRTKDYLSDIGAKNSLRVKKGDVIMSICATIGRPIILGIEACIHDGFVVFSNISDDVEPEYLYYFLWFYTERFELMAQPGTQKNLNTGIVNKTQIFIPEINQQRIILKILREIDESIEKCILTRTNLLTVRKNLINKLEGGIDEL